MSSTDATTTKHSFRGVPTVTILVGENSTPFSIHRDQLCDASSFFKAAFQSNFLEGSEMRMRLPEEEERMFDLFTQWLYNKGYEILPGHDEAKGERFMEPVKLYILADKYGVTDLKSHIITELFAMGNEKWIAGISTVAYAFEHTPQNSRLRKLLADWWVCRLSLPWFRSEVAQGWLKEHPEVACALIANTVSEETRTNVFVKVGMVEEYKDTQRVSE